MERQNIFTGIKLHQSINQALKQSAKDTQQFLSIKENHLIARNKHNYKIFKFDSCLAKNQTQQSIFDHFCLTMTEDFIDGYDSTLIFCGQNPHKNSFNDILLGKDSEQAKGLLPRFIDHATNSIKYFSSRKFMFKVSFLEINNEEMIDLLGVKKCKLEIKADKHNKNAYFVNNLETKPLQKIDQIESFYLVGNRKRQYAYSKEYRKRENSTSFFTIYLESLEQSGTIYRHSRYVFCELSSNSFEDLKTPSFDHYFHTSIASKIIPISPTDRMTFQTKNPFNLSNYSFQNVINTIVYGEQSASVPYHDSKVTKLLRQALGGNMKTSILGLIDNENSSSLEKTFRILKTLQIAAQIENTPSNLKYDSPDQSGENMVAFLQQIHRLSNELDKLRIELQILINNSQYVQKQVQNLKLKNGPEVIKDNEFCSQKHIEDHILEQKTKKQWQLKQQIKSLQKSIKEKISYIQNLQNDQNHASKDENTKQYFNEELIIAKRKQILLRVKAIKQKRLNLIPNSELEQTQRQKKKQIFALEIEFQKQRNLFTANIRALEQKLSFYQQIAQSHLKKQQIQIVKASCNYDETKRAFELPMFMVKERKVRAFNSRESLGSERKFLVSPKSKSFNNYHSLSSQKNSSSKVLNFQKKMQNILARKPKPSEEYNLEYPNDNGNPNLVAKASNKIMNSPKNSPITKLLMTQSREGKPTMNLNGMIFNREKNYNKINEYTKNVRSQYELESVDMDRVIKYNQGRQSERSKQKSKASISNKLSGPFFQMKRQKMETQPQVGNSPQDVRKILSPPRSPRRQNWAKSPLSNGKKWL